MKESSNTLSDLLACLEGCRDMLLVLNYVEEEKLVNEKISHSALFGVYSHLNLLCKEFGEYVDVIPADVQEAAALKVEKMK